jgi:Flp pilus assembly protein TadG
MSLPNARDLARRKGVVAVIAAVTLIVIFGFVSFAVDSGRIVLTQTEMQNAVDAAALAASQEIVGTVMAAGESGGDANVDANSIAIADARAMAARIAEANNVYVDPNADVRFGKRTYNEETGEWPITWDQGPYNVVQVKARKDSDDAEDFNAKLDLAFGWAVGQDKVGLQTAATAFVEARDIVVVLDFSGSMNDDSTLTAYNQLGREAVEDNLEDIWEALGPPDCGSMLFEPQYLTVEGADPTRGNEPKIFVTFKGDSIDVVSSKDLSNVVLYFEDGSSHKFDNLNQGKTGTFSWYGKKIARCYVKSGQNDSGEGPGYGERFDDSVAEVRKAFGLDDVPYPYPSGSWNSFINHCRSDSTVRSKGYEQMYGGLLFADYLLRKKYSYDDTPDLWKTPHYPFHAVKNGCTLFLDFLEDLGFGDEVGIVSYADYALWETQLTDDGQNIDLSANPINNDYEALDTIQRHKQAAHYANFTNIGDGMQKAREMLDIHSRFGARPTILLMTDGNANRRANDWSWPGYDWDDLTDFDGDGDSDYSTSDNDKRYAIWQAVQARENGVTVHTMSVGAGADRDLMEAIAFIGNGIHIEVPGGSTIAEMEEQMLDAFRQIAAKVPPAKLVYGDDNEGEEL